MQRLCLVPWGPFLKMRKHSFTLENGQTCLVPIPESLIFLYQKKIDANLKVQILDSVLANANTTPEIKNVLRLIVSKGRTQVFGEIVIAFQEILDHVNGVARGVVKSTMPLDSEERLRISAKIEGVLKKKTVLDFQINSSIVGGLMAEVGSFSFDDSVESHLKKMTEELKRRIV